MYNNIVKIFTPGYNTFPGKDTSKKLLNNGNKSFIYRAGKLKPAG